MKITKYDICKKTIHSGPKSEILQLSYAGRDSYNSFELCAECSKPIIKILKNKKLIEVKD